MKKKLPLLLTLLSSCALILASCGETPSSDPGPNSEPDSSIVPPSSPEVPPESSPEEIPPESSSEDLPPESSSTEDLPPDSSSEERLPLATPELVLNEEKTGVTFEEIEGAMEYQAQIDGGEIAVLTDLEILFSEVVGTHEIKVRAVADDALYNSDVATFSYETKYTSIAPITRDGEAGTLNWDSYDGIGVEVSLDGGNYASLGKVNSMTLSEGGVYTFRAIAGFDEDSSIFYVHQENAVNTKMVFVPKVATSAKVFEDGSAEDSATLSEKYTIEYYDGNSNSWKPSSGAKVFIEDTENAGCTEGNAVKVQYYRNGNSFRFSQKNIGLAGSYGSFSINAKGDGVANVKLQFVINNTKIINGANLTGVYATYDMGVLPANWAHYDISLADANWKITMGGQGANFETVRPVLKSTYGITVDSFGDFISNFDTFNFLVQKKTDDQVSNIYIDDLMLNPEARETGSETIVPPIVLRERYVFHHPSASAHGSFVIDGDNNVTASMVNGTGQSMVMTFAASITDGNLLKLEGKGNLDGVYVYLSSNDGGETLEFDHDTAEGAFAGLRAVAGAFVDCFDYTETGTGYDKNNQNLENVSGLRANYLADYMSSNGPASPLESGWSLMGSTDYLNLVTTDGHSDSKSARMKASSAGWMRYTSAGLITGTATAWPKASKISFWIKGAPSYELAIRFRIYFVQQVGPTNVKDGTVQTSAELKIPAGSDWTQYTITLDATKSYYGFSMALPNKSAADYIHVDDVALYSGTTLW